MDEYSSRKTAGGLVFSRKGHSLILRDSSENNRDQNVQVCSRVGCASRVNPMKGVQSGSPYKAKTSKTPFRSFVHGKETIGSSSKTSSGINTPRKSFSDLKKKTPSRVETDSETSSLQDESEETSGKTQIRVHPDNQPEDHDSNEGTSAEAESSSSGPNSKLVKRNTHKFSSFAVKEANQGGKNGASTSRYNLRNIRCNSISDIVPSGCSSSPESSQGKRRDIGGKRISEPESSFSARGKKMNGPIDNPNRGISISDSRPDSRRARNSSPSRDNDSGSSVRVRRSTARTRLSNNRLPLVESPLLTPSSPQPNISMDTTAFTSENRASSFSRPGSSSDHMQPNRSNGPYEVGLSRSFMNRDSLRQYNLDGIAEMLLALERIEQEEEPSYEQLLVLESNLFLGGLAFHDQHRDMRLDIDNMSYEELLALEERMGTVSTALPEEALTKCLKRSLYRRTVDCKEDDIKCSICQEEYGDGDEVGRLGCDHGFHVECIHQWLRLKNWCPICKASAALSPSPPQP